MLAWGWGVGFFLSTFPAQAIDEQVPWECSGYTGEEQARCVRTLIEIQHENIAKLEGQLKAQQDTVAQLKEQTDRQAAAAASQPHQAAAPPVAVAPVTPTLIHVRMRLAIHRSSFHSISATPGSTAHRTSAPASIFTGGHSCSGIAATGAAAGNVWQVSWVPRSEVPALGGVRSLHPLQPQPICM